MGGGTFSSITAKGDPEGLSPRGRGNLLLYVVRVFIEGSIPAWAGEPLSWAREYGTSGVYPRVGGGTDVLGRTHFLFEGLSPRGRGNRPEVGAHGPA